MGYRSPLVSSYPYQSRCFRRKMVGEPPQKRRKYFPDTVGSVVDIGPGCPTGVIAGTDASSRLTIATHCLFVIGPSLLCIPFISSPVVLPMWRRNVVISNTRVPCLDRCCDRRMETCIFVWVVEGAVYLYRVSYKGDMSTTLSKLDTTSDHAKARVRHKLGRSTVNLIRMR